MVRSPAGIHQTTLDVGYLKVATFAFPDYVVDSVCFYVSFFECLDQIGGYVSSGASAHIGAR